MHTAIAQRPDGRWVRVNLAWDNATDILLRHYTTPKLVDQLTRYPAAEGPTLESVRLAGSPAYVWSGTGWIQQ